MAADPEKDLRVALDAARMAGVLVRDGFRAPGRHRRKGPHDVVTRWDLTSERLIFAQLAQAFPRDHRLGEEQGFIAGRGPDNGRTWLVDPLDGTINYASGIPFWCISIALACNGEVRLGVIHDPLREETFAAVAGRGAWREPNHESCRPRRLQRSADAVVAADAGDADTPAGAHRVDALRSRVRAVRTLGSTALSLTYLAAGRLDGVFQASGLGAVDVAAGGLIAREAGVRVSDAAGGPWVVVADPSRGTGIAAAMPAVHRLLVEEPPGPEWIRDATQSR
ncbi:MAG: inositol monophosphatase [Chloroflexi bacterium]|nr:inositol monophosphatase [Chloroflexota bacterium]